MKPDYVIKAKHVEFMDKDGNRIPLSTTAQIKVGAQDPQAKPLPHIDIGSLASFSASVTFDLPPDYFDERTDIPFEPNRIGMVANEDYTSFSFVLIQDLPDGFSQSVKAQLAVDTVKNETIADVWWHVANKNFFHEGKYCGRQVLPFVTTREMMIAEAERRELPYHFAEPPDWEIKHYAPHSAE